MKIKKILLAVALCSGMVSATSAHAVLTLNLNGQGVYDSDRDITWLRDTDLAFTNSFGITGIGIGGSMSWFTAQNWITAMNTANYLGYNNWRMATAIDTGTAGCNFSYSGTDCGYSVNTATGEIAHLFFDELNNKSRFVTPTVQQPGYGLLNTDPFFNFSFTSTYWYGTENAANTNQAWNFSMYNGHQGVGGKYTYQRVLVVRNGGSPVIDQTPTVTSPVPEPESYAMLLAGLGLLSFTARRRKQSA